MDFFRRFSPAGGPAIEPSVVVAHDAQLRDVAKDLEPYADRAVAHLDKREPEAAPNVAALDAAIDLIGTRYLEYQLLLTGEERYLDLPSTVNRHFVLFFARDGLRRNPRIERGG
jgi:hypothetical protein